MIAKLTLKDGTSIEEGNTSLGPAGRKQMETCSGRQFRVHFTGRSHTECFIMRRAVERLSSHEAEVESKTRPRSTSPKPGEELQIDT